MRQGKVQRLQSATAAVIRALGYNTKDAHLVDSPARVARFLAEWHTADKEPPKLTTFPNKGYDAMVLTGDIHFHSLCAHHGLPFFGTVNVGYIPKTKLLGLSKFARTIDHFAHRFQVQERLTHDIANHLLEALDPIGLGILVKAEHLCMSMRGVCKPGHYTTTSVLRGALFEMPEARAEFMQLATLGGGRS